MDADRRLDSFADYRGGFMTYDQHTGLDFILADVDQAEAGIPVLAARGGTRWKYGTGKMTGNTVRTAAS